MSNISVIGAGYVGLITAVCFAELGHKVTLLEIDRKKLESLEHGVMPINEISLAELWQHNYTEGRISVTSNYIQGLLGAEFAFIAVGTPSTRSGKPNLKWLMQSTISIAEAASASLTLVIKSTVPAGTADMVTRLLAQHNHNGYFFPVVSNPEFLREGAAVYDFFNPSRIVVGSSNRSAAEAVAGLYKGFDAPIIMCDSNTAEMSKYASNVFLATRISFMNEIARLCEEYDVDVVKVSNIMGLDPRFGTGYLNAGLGWGGSCLPKDVRGLIHMAKSRKVSLPITQATQRINLLQSRLVIKKLSRLLGSLEGKTIGILGLSFKPDSDDMREAPSLEIIHLLQEHGCLIRAYDPMAMEPASQLLSDVTFGVDAYDVARGSDALILVTEWDEFRELNMHLISSLMKSPIMIDGRNIYSPEAMFVAGFTYEGVGRRGVSQQKSQVLPTKAMRREPVLSGDVISAKEA
ncbi:MAG: UDP-glucose/GDP-mannose dehydrogenase family protein [Dehalococcoidia bacterium]